MVLMEATTTNATRKPNRYGGPCADCGHHVEAAAGYVVGKASRNARWEIAHLPGECPIVVTVPIVPDAPAAATTHPAWYRPFDEASGEDYGNWAEEQLAMSDWAEAYPEEAAALEARRMAPTESGVIRDALAEYARNESLTDAERGVIANLLAGATTGDVVFAYHP